MKFKKEEKWGYQAYKDEDGKKKTIHSRMGEKKYGMIRYLKTSIPTT